MPRRKEPGGRKREIAPITGPQLAKLLVKDGWQAGRKGRHGRVYTKTVAGKTLVTIVSLKTVPIPAGTLAAILGPQQTALGKQGLRALIDKYGSR